MERNEELAHEAGESCPICEERISPGRLCQEHASNPDAIMNAFTLSLFQKEG